MPKPVVGVIRREPCTKCGLPVVLAERLHINNQLYHRTCFSCSRCNTQLTLANYSETEIKNEFCCETCPSEESEVSNDNRSISDEEKSASITRSQVKEDYYSDLFETALENSKDKALVKNYTLDTEQSNAFIQARSRFITSQLDSSDDDVPDLPETVPPVIKLNEPPDLLKFVKNREEDFDLVDHIKDNGSVKNSVSIDNSSLDCNIVNSDLSDSDKNQPQTANTLLLENSTKESDLYNIKDVIVIDDTINDSNIEYEDLKSHAIPSKTEVDSEFTSNINEELFNETTIKTSDKNNEKNLTIESDSSEKSFDNVNETIITISSEGNEKNDTTGTTNSLITSPESIIVMKGVSSKDYPEDLNPFGDDDQEVSLNPFDGDDDDDEEEEASLSVERKKISLPNISKIGPHLYTTRYSVNPFDTEDEVPVEQTAESKVPNILISNYDLTEVEKKPVPLPRKERTSVATPNTTPRKSGLESSSIFGSNTSLSSAHSSIESGRPKKKIAPKPPTSAPHSPKSVPRSRKLKKAPLPPASTPFISKTKESACISISPIFFDETMDVCDIEQEKVIKDEVNRNRQSQLITETILPTQPTLVKTKRTKGPAPSRPIAEKRSVKPFPLSDIKHELDVIEIQMQGLEKQGVRLEELIRDKCEGPDADIDAPIPPEVDNLILELFEVVNEKNGLFRRQAELMYLRRQHRLEEEYADLEYQIRCLLLTPEPNKTDSDKSREEQLINRLYEVVEQRNEIVECLEMDRVREAEEDHCIHDQLISYSSKNSSGEEPSIKKKTKKFKFKSPKKLDVDKDIDETEVTSPKKEKKKKKFTIF